MVELRRRASASARVRSGDGLCRIPPSPLRRILDNLGEALAIVEACATGERSDEPSRLVQRPRPFGRQRSIRLGEPPQHPNCPERPAVVRSLGENLEVLAEIFHWQNPPLIESYGGRFSAACRGCVGSSIPHPLGL